MENNFKLNHEPNIIIPKDLQSGIESPVNIKKNKKSIKDMQQEKEKSDEAILQSMNKDSQKDFFGEIRKMIREILSENKYNPWAVCTSSVGRENKEKYEKCVMSVKKKQGMVEEESEKKTKEQEKKKNTLIIKKSVDNLTPDKIKLIKKFIIFCLKHLGIDKPAVVVLTGERGGPITTTASYNPETKETWVYTKNRGMLGDVARSIAHELTHYKQDIEGRITDDSGKDGSEEENEANATAGVIIRKFGRENKEIFD